MLLFISDVGFIWDVGFFTKHFLFGGFASVMHRVYVIRCGGGCCNPYLSCDHGCDCGGVVVGDGSGGSSSGGWWVVVVVVAGGWLKNTFKPATNHAVVIKFFNCDDGVSL